MKSLVFLAVVLLAGCGQIGQTSGTAMLPPQLGNYCEAPVDGACLGCDISCPSTARASCKTGTTTNIVGGPPKCTRAPVCECR